MVRWASEKMVSSFIFSVFWFLGTVFSTVIAVDVMVTVEPVSSERELD